MKRRLFIAAFLFLSEIAPFSAQTLEVTPSRVMVDESATIRANGLKPGERVTIRGELADGAGARWTSEVECVADAQGTVDLSKQAPVKGSYDEISAMGLVWSMRPAEQHVASYTGPHELGTQIIQFRLTRGGQPIASAQLEQNWIGENIRRIRLEGQLHGVLFLPNTTGRVPGVLVLGGSEGGLPRERAAWLASHGYAALALAYFRYEDLPAELEGIPLEYFGKAIGWMMQRPEIQPDRIAVVGASRGGELALQLGSIYPQISAVVAYVPANVRYPSCCRRTSLPYAWTLNGQPLAYVPHQSLLHPEPGVVMRAAIAVEKTHGPILLIAGQDDGVWESSRMTELVVQRLKQEHFTQDVQLLSYPHAGHRAGRPEIVPTWHGAVRHPVSGREMNLGGNPKGDAESSLDAIPKVLAFLQKSLPTGTAQPAHKPDAEGSEPPK